MTNKFGPQNESEEVIFAEEKFLTDLQCKINAVLNAEKIDGKTFAKISGLKGSWINDKLFTSCDIKVKNLAKLFHYLKKQCLFLALNWTKEWPKVEGDYLYCCRMKNTTKNYTELFIVKVRPTANPNDLIFIGGGHILFEEEWEGVWVPFNIELPDLDKLLKD